MVEACSCKAGTYRVHDRGAKDRDSLVASSSLQMSNHLDQETEQSNLITVTTQGKVKTENTFFETGVESIFIGKSRAKQNWHYWPVY